MRDSDEALMLAYAQGDMKAFEMLYQRYREPLYRYVLRFCSDDALANDLFQGSWEKIIKGRRKYRSKVPFRAWMYRITRNHVTDHYRRLKPETDQEPGSLPGTLATPEDHFSKLQNRADLVQAIDQLPLVQKEVILLKLEAGLDLATIADVTGVNSETAKSRLRYAVRKLKQAMQVHEPEMQQ